MSNLATVVVSRNSTPATRWAELDRLASDQEA
jgi:hypothetical protein